MVRNWRFRHNQRFSGDPKHVASNFDTSCRLRLRKYHQNARALLLRSIWSDILSDRGTSLFPLVC